MPLFTDDEYTDLDRRPGLDEAWKRLPPILHLDGIGVRWVGPLLELGHHFWLGRMNNLGRPVMNYGGWHILATAKPFFDNKGDAHPHAAKVFGRVVRRLTQSGEVAGPTGVAEHWAAWLAFQWVPLHRVVRALAERRGYDR